MARQPKSLPRQADREKIPLRVRHDLLTEAGYKCGNPACPHVITLDLHHLEYVSDGGGDDVNAGREVQRRPAEKCSAR